MKSYFISILVVFFFLATTAQAQESNLCKKTVSGIKDSLQLDSLRIVPGSIQVKKGTRQISAEHYRIDYRFSKIIFSPKSGIQRKDTLVISYRTFPKELSNQVKEKKIAMPQTGRIVNFPSTTKSTSGDASIFSGDFQTNGSLSRGFSLGNQQDAVLESNLNLQLSGAISDNFNLRAALSDNTLPVQPDGSSQQIQEFDKVFIEVYNDQTSVIGGDFLMYSTADPYLKYNRKVQGIHWKTRQTAADSAAKISSSISGAVSKSKFCRKKISAQEGNQGPYRLTGCGGEQYIIIIAGSEKVYMDGRLLKRGQENDYIIDYNTAELTFTARQLITRESRIRIEFEYTERSYARFIFESSQEISTDKGSIYLRFFSESDAKNQRLAQSLSVEEESLLRQAGDDPLGLFVPNVDSVSFSDDKVLYTKKDTLVGSEAYEIYVYTTDPAATHFRVGFSYVGEGRGNYQLASSAANGRVYEWTAPAEGGPTGSYEPVTLLKAPESKQVFSLGGNWRAGALSNVFLHLSASNFNKNTFSEKDASDNLGLALQSGLLQQIPLRNTGDSLFTRVSLEWIQHHFSPADPFREVEYQRDWNLVDSLEQHHETNAGLGIHYKNQKGTSGNYELEWKNLGDAYQALKNNLSFTINRSTTNASIQLSGLTTDNTGFETSFYRGNAMGSLTAGSWELGAQSQFEYNLWRRNPLDSLMNNSGAFYDWGLFLRRADSTGSRSTIEYRRRKDFLPNNNRLKEVSYSDNIASSFQILQKSNTRLTGVLKYRNFTSRDSLISENKKSESLTARINWSQSLWKRFIQWNTTYQLGSGLEPKKEYSYLKVPDGQGVYEWVDYNSNSIKEVNEFEVAAFQDQANYIRIILPSAQYIKAWQNMLSQTIRITPSRIIRSEKFVARQLKQIRNNFAVKYDQKTTAGGLADNILPDFCRQDSTIVHLNSSARNVFSYTSSKARFSISMPFQKSSRKTLMANGIDKQERQTTGIQSRWGFWEGFSLSGEFMLQEKIYRSQYFSRKNYHLEGYETGMKLSYQLGFLLNTDLEYSYSFYEDSKRGDLFNKQLAGIALNYQIKDRGNLQAMINYIHMSYNKPANTSAGYMLLQGLKPGNNLVWQFSMQQKIFKNIQAVLYYSGRSSPDNKAIHTGNLQLRAVF